MDTLSLECGVCKNQFSEEHVPRILPCSHSLCGGCINNIISTLGQHCPFCRKSFTANSAEDLVINRDLLSVAIQISYCRIPKSSSRTQDALLPTVIEDLEKRLTEGVTNCRAVKAKVIGTLVRYKDMEDVARASNEEILNQIKNLEKLIRLNNEAIDDIDRNSKFFENRYDVTTQQTNKLLGSTARIKFVKNFSSGGATVDEAENILKVSEENVNGIQNALPAPGIHDDFVKKKLLEKILMRRIEEMIKRGNGDKTFVDITVDELSYFCGTWSKFCQGKFFAKETSGVKRMANIRFESNNQIFLTHLKEQIIPPRSFVIKHEALLVKSSRRAYIDLHVDGTFLGRIIIKVIEEGNYAQKFLHLCTGALGSSLAKSKLINYRKEYNDRGLIKLTEPVLHGQASTDLVLPEVNWIAEEKRDIYEDTPFKAGDVRGLHIGGKNSSFLIVTRDHPSLRGSNCFGVVEEGLPALRNAEIQYRDLRKVNITDFGRIFTF